MNSSESIAHRSVNRFSPLSSIKFSLLLQVVTCDVETLCRQKETRITLLNSGFLSNSLIVTVIDRTRWTLDTTDELDGGSLRNMLNWVEIINLWTRGNAPFGLQETMSSNVGIVAAFWVLIQARQSASFTLNDSTVWCLIAAVAGHDANGYDGYDANERQRGMVL